MRLLLDTHVLYWWQVERNKLTPGALSAISGVENSVYVSLASAWEMAIKVGAGKWPGAIPLLDRFELNAQSEQFAIIPITLPHVRAAGLMRSPHRDPFDRMLAAQTAIEGLTLVTADPKVAALGAPVLW